MFKKLSLIAVAALAGCAEGSEERYGEQMGLGELYFRGGKFEESIGRYTEAAELAVGRDEKYKAALGLAAATAEYGHALYQQADSLMKTRNRDAAERSWARANEMHDIANKTFAKLVVLRPGESVTNYNWGLFFFKRSMALNDTFPYAPGKPGVDQRRKERDEAIKHFTTVLAPEQDDITNMKHGPKCVTPQAHRYLALLYFARSNWDSTDAEQARLNIVAYLNYLKALRAYVRSSWPQEDAKEKSDKEKEIERLRQELFLTQGLLKDQQEGLKDTLKNEEELRKSLSIINMSKTQSVDGQAVKDALKRLEDAGRPPLDDAQYERLRNAVTRELAALEGLKKSFEEAAKEPSRGQP